ncbi:MAG: zinc-binding alcohol dehydrogenase [Treponema sp.]|jgi:threonine dehydrogenase-like Zn-dependent dehydrogenase|nr:zinc-binding alcohol dehydrogenase [Treponema sp.]
MPKELKLGADRKAVLVDYTDPPTGNGEVKVKSIYGAPKHGTELTMYQYDPHAETYYDEEAHIFKKRDVPDSAYGKSGLGNMWVGEIIETGPGVFGFSIGERVAGYGNLKPTHIVKQENLLKMAERMSWQEAVCFDPLQFAIGGVRDGHVRFGDTVLISGLGAIGLMAAQAARLAGAYLVAVSDPIEKRRKAALENGADIAFDPTKEDAGLLLRDKTGNIGCDVVIETSGSYKAIEQGIRALAYGGNLACVGWLKECHIPINLGYEGHFNQTKIIFSRACSEPNNDYPRWSFNRICREAWDMLNKGMFKCGNIIDPIVPFEKSDEGYITYIVEHPERSVKLGVIF